MDAAEEPAAKRPRGDASASASGDPRTVVLLNVDGLASRLLAKDKATDAERAVAERHAAALLTHLCAVAGTPPDVLCLNEVRWPHGILPAAQEALTLTLRAVSQVHFRAHSAGRRGELESLDSPLAADRKHAEKAHATVRTCVAHVRTLLLLRAPDSARSAQAAVCA